MPTHRERRNLSNPRSPVNTKERRQQQAIQRQDKYDKLTTKQKLDRQVAGGFHGHEYFRLAHRLQEETEGKK